MKKVGGYWKILFRKFCFSSITSFFICLVAMRVDKIAGFGHAIDDEEY